MRFSQYKQKAALIIGALLALFFLPVLVYAATCTEVNGGANSTITSDCEYLRINGAGNVTINSGNTISGGPALVFTNTTTSLINAGTISGNNAGVLLDSNSSIMTFTNSGQISSPYNNGIELYANTLINTLTNTGEILGANVGIYNYGGAGFGSLNPDVVVGTIAILNNSQGGGSQTPLTYYGVLPTNYNIIINSPTHFGQLSNQAYDILYSGTMTFGISNLSSAGSSSIGILLPNVLININPSGISNIGASSLLVGEFITVTSPNGYSGQLIYKNFGNWDFMLLALGHNGPTAADTQASLNTQSRRLRSTFNSTMASGNFANMNTYDCNLFDKNNMCISAGGRYTNVDNPSSNNSAAVVVLGYKVNSNIRIGGFLDQSVSNNTPSGINISNKNPMMGAFAVWNKNADGLGYQVKLANAYQDKDVRSTRDAFGETGEAGTGKTNLNTQSYVG